MHRTDGPLQIKYLGCRDPVTPAGCSVDACSSQSPPSLSSPLTGNKGRLKLSRCASQYRRKEHQRTCTCKSSHTQMQRRRQQYRAECARFRWFISSRRRWVTRRVLKLTLDWSDLDCSVVWVIRKQTSRALGPDMPRHSSDLAFCRLVGYEGCCWLSWAVSDKLLWATCVHVSLYDVQRRTCRPNTFLFPSAH